MSTPKRAINYDVGDLITLVATVTGTTGTPAQPSAFLFLTKNPLGTVASYQFGVVGASVANPTAGCFYKDVTGDVAGQWYYRAVATGLVQAAEEWSFLVDASQVI